MTPSDDGFDGERLPGLDGAARALLQRLRDHPAAPLFRDRSGHRLSRSERPLLRLRRWLESRAPVRATGREPPGWVWRHARRCAREVPHWRALERLPADWSRLSFTCRADLSADIARFVPARLPIDRLVCFTTTGTTGHPLALPSHPQVAALYFAHHLRALRRFGVVPRAGAGEVGIVLAGFQQRCFTYLSVDPLRGGCGVVKLNLDPGEWRRPADRAAYLDAIQPELISGDPLSLSELAALDMRHRPRALLSTSMALLPGLRTQLEARFACPVLDLYSMNEVGPIAVFDPRIDAYALLQPRLFVEIVDARGRSLPDGERGEIVVTGGFNPWLPLLRYRTGDHAMRLRTPFGPALAGLEGRPPVRFRRGDGRWLNNIEITHALKALPLRRYALHQQADGRLRLRVDAAPDAAGRALAAVIALFGAGPAVRLERLEAADKVVQYTTELLPS